MGKSTETESRGDRDRGWGRTAPSQRGFLGDENVLELDRNSGPTILNTLETTELNMLKDEFCNM